MNKAIYYKALQIKNKYRNSEKSFETQILGLTTEKLKEAESYLNKIESLGIKYTYHGHVDYPRAFYKMIEPPLFLEYLGSPCWNIYQFISVVGSRNCHDLSSDWINSQLVKFLKLESIGLVSGGAQGVDIQSHLACLRSQRPTIAVIPSGLGNIYPKDLNRLGHEIIQNGGALLSEFSYDDCIRKAYFYFRNRLIANLGQICLVIQASLKSGTMLTVHHALQNGRPVMTIPSHPCLSQFSGNLKLIDEGAIPVADCVALYQLWKSEAWSRSGY